MSVLHVNHIKAKCNQRFSELIDMSDVITGNQQEKETKFLSRALAAFALAAAAKVDDSIAAQSLVDEYHDDGIDAFFFDRDEHVAYIVQSKWIKSGSGAMDLSSALNFVEGVTHFFNNDLSLLGPKLQLKAGDIQAATSDINAHFVFIVAYTGKQSLSNEVLGPLERKCIELNDDSDMVSLRVLNLKEIRDIVVTGIMGEPVNLTIMLKDFGAIKEPYRAFYGQVDIADIKSWASNGDRLYYKNIRNFKGNTEVNNAILSTIKDSPDNFLYFNNGITLLCTELLKQPLGGSGTTSGVFECKGASVINGAQTVGSIITALSLPDAPPSSAKVMVRLISLDKCPPDFASDATRATNTQNKIEKRDFAALDEQQSRLKTDLFLSCGKDYVYRAGAQSPSEENGCTLDEATVALACAYPEVTYCVDAKRAISKLYEDINKPPYTVLFNRSLTAAKLWRSVLVLRVVEAFVKRETGKRDGGKDRLVAIHGNRILLYLVFRALESSIFSEDEATALATVFPVATDRLGKMREHVRSNYENSYAGNIFKSATKCREIVTAIA